MNKDIEYIAQNVHQWPEGAGYVRLDGDGEICFTKEGGHYTAEHDYYPDGEWENEDHPAATGDTVGRKYTQAEWRAATPITLGTLPFFNEQEVFDYVARHLLEQGKGYPNLLAFREDLPDDHCPLLVRLQETHDTRAPVHWPLRLSLVARDFHLSDQVIKDHQERANG